jgi:hypothetical protein
MRCDRCNLVRPMPFWTKWTEILQKGDGVLFAAMLGRDDNSIRLRQSMPYVGLLSEQEVKMKYEEAAG